MQTRGLTPCSSLAKRNKADSYINVDDTELIKELNERGKAIMSGNIILKHVDASGRGRNLQSESKVKIVVVVIVIVKIEGSNSRLSLLVFLLNLLL